MSIVSVFAAALYIATAWLPVVEPSTSTTETPLYSSLAIVGDDSKIVLVAVDANVHAGERSDAGRSTSVVSINSGELVGSPSSSMPLVA